MMLKSWIFNKNNLLSRKKNKQLKLLFINYCLVWSENCEVDKLNNYV